MLNFHIFQQFKNVFNRLNPLNSFKWDGSDEELKIFSSNDLLEDTVEKYPKFKFVILIALYHILNTVDSKNEFLTVLTNDFRLIADLVEGNHNEVEIPEIVQFEASRSNVFITCHNHFNGAIIPSLGDFKNSICPKILFTIIVSQGNIGILVNNFNKFDKDTLKLLKIDINDYIEYIRFSFIINNEKEIAELDKLNLNEYEYNIRYQLLFDKYVARNNLKFVNEFNARMEKYNLYLIYINY